MNGKDILVDLSYIDRKFIEESEKDTPNSILCLQPKKKRRPRRLLLIAAILAAMLFLMGAVLYTRWTHSMETTFRPSESAKQQAEKSGLSTMYETKTTTEPAPEDGSIPSATDQGITVSVVQTIVDSREAHIVLRVEGFTPPEDFGVRPWVWQDKEATLDGSGEFWNSSGADFDNGIFFNTDKKAYTYTDGIPVEENAEGWKGRYLRSDGSLELDVWYRLRQDMENPVGKEYELHLTGFGTTADTGKADMVWNKMVEGHCDLKFPLKGSDEVKTYQLNERLSDNVTLTEIEIGQITTKAIYKTDTYWDGWEKLELLQPQLAGIQLKDGTLIQLADAREGYQDEDALIYFVEYQSYEGTVELDQIESLAYYDRWETDTNGKKVPIYRYVPLS